MNYLIVGEKIKERLESLNQYRVYASRDVDIGKKQAQRAPCIFISYGGESAIETSGQAALITQIWIVIVAVANERANTTGTEANRQAGEMLGDIMPQLMRWAPTTAEPMFTSLKLTQSPVPHGYDDKFLYYPVAFETTIRLRGTSNGC